MTTLLGKFPILEIAGRKNQEIINCDKFLTLIAILWVETDDKVQTYSQPKIVVPVSYQEVDYKFAIDFSVKFQTGDTWWIAFIDAKTQKLFKSRPELVETLKGSCASSGGRYIAMRAARNKGMALDIVIGA